MKVTICEEIRTGESVNSQEDTMKQARVATHGWCGKQGPDHRGS